MEAGNLKPGEHVVTLSGASGTATATVAWVHAVAGQADIYNLTVAQDHTYTVGNGQYVVHNVGGDEHFPFTPDLINEWFGVGDGPVTLWRAVTLEEWWNTYLGQEYSNPPRPYVNPDTGVETWASEPSKYFAATREEAIQFAQDTKGAYGDMYLTSGTVEREFLLQDSVIAGTIHGGTIREARIETEDLGNIQDVTGYGKIDLGSGSVSEWDWRCP